ncbi:hypothetical protein [Halovenus sp. HT40]|uniref:hypothetical protein n=1 Tax=Halovenus sp. HT40 TaxID=3126691 RepID=UPI00300EE9F9
MTDEQPTDWFGVISQIIDLWLALQLTVGVGLAVGVGVVVDSLGILSISLLAVVPFVLALGLVAADRVPDTRPLWAVGFAVLGAGIGLSYLSSFLEISTPEHVRYLIAVALVVGIYGVHRTLRYIVHSTTPQ